ncbi:MAG: aldose 1-epimerase family protein [Brevinema sp.]
MIVLENSYASVKINLIGSELTSFYDKEDQLEYVWQAGDIWPKSAPILFPIVGVLKNDCCLYQDQTLTIGRHGFAREQKFEINQISSTEVICSFSATPEFKKNYPFDFTLSVHWILEGKTIQSKYTIENCGLNKMLYSFGLHPAFTLCFNEDQSIDTLSLRLEKEEDWIITAGLNKDSTHFPQTKNLGASILPLSHSIFDNDALIFEKLQSRSVILQSSAHHHTLSTSWSENLDILGIWSKPKAPFVCIEPWAGICDVEDSNGILEHKKAIRHLATGEKEIFTFNASITKK